MISMAKKGKEAKRREKKQRTGKKHSTVKIHEYYDVSSGEVKRNRKTCPRCGPGAWLGEHKGRLYCGKCGYTEFERRPASGQPEPSQPAEAPKEKPEEAKPSEKPEEEPREAPSEEKPEEAKPEKPKPYNNSNNKPRN